MAREGLRRLLDDVIFEVIPMKSALERATALPPGASVSVTASPVKGMGATMQLAEELADHGYRVVPHLSARLIRDRVELAEIVRRAETAGMERAFIVGGDGEEPGEFFDAISLIRALEEMGHPFTGLGITGYPEGHPFLPEADLDRALAEKQPYGSYIATQMCFDVAQISGWLTQRREMGIGLPVLVGIPGAVDAAKLLSIGARIGVGSSLRFLARHRKAMGHLLRPGHYTPDDLVAALTLLAADPTMGVGGLHVFTFNQVEDTVEWFEGPRAEAARSHDSEASG